MNDETKKDAPASQGSGTGQGSEARTSLILGGLMMLIAISLAGLWIIERGRSSRAEHNEAQLRMQLAPMLQQQKKMQMVGQMLAEQGGLTPIARDQLPTRPVEYDGQKRAVLLLSASLGGQIGFQPGDIIEVSQPPATQPAGP